MTNLSELKRIGKQIFNAKLALFSVILLFVMGAGVKAQAQSVESDGARKCRVHEPPEYPELARLHGIKGLARVMVTVHPDGSFTTATKVTAHPLLLSTFSRPYAHSQLI